LAAALSSDALTLWLVRLNDFVMHTWTNDIAVGINQDTLGVAGRRIDNSSALGAGTILSAEFEPLKLGSSANVALMAVAVRTHCLHIEARCCLVLISALCAGPQECGGEPANQKWKLDSGTGTLSNAATGTCVNVPGCKSEIVYDPCSSTGPSCGPTKNANEQWSLTPGGSAPLPAA